MAKQQNNNRISQARRRKSLVNVLVAKREERSVAPARSESLEDLVAKYAPIGRRRGRWSIARTVAFVGPMFISVAILAWVVGATGLPGIVPSAQQDEQLKELSRLTQSLAMEVREIGGERKEFQAQREKFREQSADLAEELAAVNVQRTELEQQQFAFESQGRRMAAAINEIDSRRATIQTQQTEIDLQGPLIQQELAAMIAERDRLEARRLEFSDQTEMLSVEIAAINEQRRELAKQRLQVDRQRREIQVLLDQTSEIQSRLMRPDDSSPEAVGSQSVDSMVAKDEQSKGGEAVTVARTDSWQPPAIDAMAAVGEGELSEMRGGISLGDDMVVDIGLTRSASVNGVQQYSSTIQFDDVLGSVSSEQLAAVGGGVLIQNGSGNVAPVELLDSTDGNIMIIQNSLDNQEIATENVFDISIDNVSTTIGNIAAGEAIDQSLMLSN